MNPTEQARLAWAVEHVDAYVRQLRRRADYRNATSRAEAMRNRYALVGATHVQNMLYAVLEVDTVAVNAVPLHVMSPKHLAWKEFVQRLEGPRGLNFRKDAKGKTCWICHHDFRAVRRILKTMEFDIPTSLAVFVENGGYCDCEVFFNVGVTRRRLRRRRKS